VFGYSNLALVLLEALSLWDDEFYLRERGTSQAARKQESHLLRPWPPTMMVDFPRNVLGSLAALSTVLFLLKQKHVCAGLMTLIFVCSLCLAHCDWYSVPSLKTAKSLLKIQNRAMRRYTKSWKRNEEEKLKKELCYFHSVTLVGHWPVGKSLA
jgi:hypothetical protein